MEVSREHVFGHGVQGRAGGGEAVDIDGHRHTLPPRRGRRAKNDGVAMTQRFRYVQLAGKMRAC
jgi:hypothetical protein